MLSTSSFECARTNKLLGFVTTNGEFTSIPESILRGLLSANITDFSNGKVSLSESRSISVSFNFYCWTRLLNSSSNYFWFLMFLFCWPAISSNISFFGRNSSRIWFSSLSRDDSTSSLGYGCWKWLNSVYYEKCVFVVIPSSSKLSSLICDSRSRSKQSELDISNSSFLDWGAYSNFPISLKDRSSNIANSLSI